MAAQVDTTVSMIRGPTAEPVRYFPEAYTFQGGSFSGGKGSLPSTFFPEMNTGDTTRATIVADIASAQHEDIKRIIAVDLANGKCWDASREIALDVLEIFRTERDEIPDWGRPFLEEHLGIANVNIAEREWHEAA